MIFTYRYNTIDANGRIAPETDKVDAAQWLAYLQANTARYGNLHEFVEASLPAIRDENPLIAAAVATQIDELFHQVEPTAVFQFAMFCWHAFQNGNLPAAAWAAALAIAWHCGDGAMLDHVALSEATVIRMFETADREALFQVSASQKDWVAHVASLPDELTIYRGITTRTKHTETGFCWTTDPEQAKQISGRSVQTPQDIPGVIQASVPKAAILAKFEPGAEVVIHPGATKLNVTTNFLRGSGLTKFRQNWKKWKAEEARRLKEAQASR